MEIGEDFQQEESFLSQELDVSMNSEEGDSHGPNTRDTECENCSTPATVFCEQCVSSYCDQCSTLRHKHPKRHGHDITAIRTSNGK